MSIAKVFWSGRSQAVRLPKEYRFDVEEVRIRRRGNTVILEPIPNNWIWLDKLAGTLDTDFVQAAAEPASAQDRPALDTFFK